MASNQIIYSIAIPVGACAIAGVTMLVLYIQSLPSKDVQPEERETRPSGLDRRGSLGDVGDLSRDDTVAISLRPGGEGFGDIGGKRRRKTRSKRHRSQRRRR